MQPLTTPFSALVLQVVYLSINISSAHWYVAEIELPHYVEDAAGERVLRASIGLMDSAVAWTAANYPQWCTPEQVRNMLLPRLEWMAAKEQWPSYARCTSAEASNCDSRCSLNVALLDERACGVACGSQLRLMAFY